VTFKEPEQQKENELDTQTYMDERHEYMKWHYRLNHASQRGNDQNGTQENITTLHNKNTEENAKDRDKSPLMQ
jgi:hypothetical protein